MEEVVRLCAAAKREVAGAIHQLTDRHAEAHRPQMPQTGQGDELTVLVDDRLVLNSVIVDDILN